MEADLAYWNVTAWRRAAHNAAQSLAKGHPVVVHGRVRQRSVDRPVDGRSTATVAVTYTDLEAVSFGLDLSRCLAVYQRAPIGPQVAAPLPSPAPERRTGEDWGLGVEGAGSDAP